MESFLRSALWGFIAGLTSVCAAGLVLDAQRDRQELQEQCVLRCGSPRAIPIPSGHGCACPEAR
jgi:hypothetical protein